MRLAFLAGALIGALALGACASASLTPAQDLEEADTVFLDAYAATITVVNGVETVAPSKTTQAEAIRTQANAALAQEQAAYKAGQSITALVTSLEALEAQAKTLASS